MLFTKYHGTGNDFVMIEDLDDRLRLPPELIARICDRHRGVGADGVIRIVRGAGPDAPGEVADFFMDYSNADGNVAEMCGNGIRCLAVHVFDRGLTDRSEIDVWTRAGLKRLLIEEEDGVAARVTVDMGIPSLERKAIPMTGEPTDTFVEQPLAVDGLRLQATAVSMGNPHCVLFVEPVVDLQSMDVARLGRIVEHRPEFPLGANVEFAKVVDGRVLVRVWERGSGLTMACGTGACASLVASALAGRTGREAEVEFPGGVLEVAWRRDDHVVLTGPAVKVFEGRIDEAWLRPGSRPAGTAS
jgi:diaminopimelate epimerase